MIFAHAKGKDKHRTLKGYFFSKKQDYKWQNAFLDLSVFVQNSPLSKTFQTKMDDFDKTFQRTNLKDLSKFEKCTNNDNIISSNLFMPG